MARARVCSVLAERQYIRYKVILGKMKRFLNFRFPYLDKLRYRLLHVFIILIFSVFFLLIFEPFNIKAWLKYPEWIKNLGLISLGFIFSFIIAFSQLLVRTIIKIQNFKVWHLISWLMVEIIFLSVLLTIIFADFTKGFLGELLITFKYSSIGLALPYTFSLLLLVLIHQNNKLAFNNTNIPDKKSGLISIKDERGQVKFSIDKSSVLYLESTDNYVTIYYVQEGGIKKEMVRNSMKKIEKQLSSSSLFRCHRSFIVNIDNVQWFKKKGRNYFFKMKSYDTIIPVSRAFVPAIKSLIQS